MRNLIIMLVVVGLTGSSVYGQSATFDDLTLDNGGEFGAALLKLVPNGDTSKEFRMFANSSGLNISGPGGFGVLRVVADAKAASLHISETGVGIGTSTPLNAGLHIKSNDGLPFSNARLRIENQDTPAADRTQIFLSNNGPARITMADTNIGSAWSLITTSNDQFQIRKNGAGTANMAILPDGSFLFRVGGASNFQVLPNGDAIVAGMLFESSDRNLKKNIVSVDPQTILQKVTELPVSHWTYKKDADGIRHVGPMAQDFHAAFGLGINDTSISTLDSSGIALAAIKGLHQRLEMKDKQLQELSQLIVKMNIRLEQLEVEVQSATDIGHNRRSTLVSLDAPKSVR